MANTKKNTEPVDVEAPVADTTQEAPVAEKVYKFQSENKFLTCTALGVQFVDGKAEVKSLEVAKALANIQGVTLIEE